MDHDKSLVRRTELANFEDKGIILSPAHTPPTYDLEDINWKWRDFSPMEYANKVDDVGSLMSKILAGAFT